VSRDDDGDERIRALSCKAWHPRLRQDGEKAHPCSFSPRFAEIAISGVLHFKRLVVVENGGTSMCRTQAGEKLGFSPAC